MGAAVFPYWPGITDDESGDSPGFDNDCKAWGNWMAERYNHNDVIDALKYLGVSALLSHITDGMQENEVDWVHPDELAKAAERLRKLVLSRDWRVKRILETYELSANGVDSVQNEFAQDLADIKSIAMHAKNRGIVRMTLEVNW